MSNLKNLAKYHKTNKYDLGYIDVYEKYFEKVKNVEFFCGDQSDEKILQSIINKFKYFDIIIDDGSHISKDVIKSFNFLFEHLSEGGLYMIEDLHYSYYPRYGGSRINLKKKIHHLIF